MIDIAVCVRQVLWFLKKELDYRKLTSIVSPDFPRDSYPYHQMLLHIDSDNSLSQITVVELFSTKARELSLEEYSARCLSTIAKRLALKLCRPFPITCFPMELPKNVNECCQDSYGGLLVRAVTDYLLDKDQLITRYDMLVKWDEEHPL